MAQFQLSRRIFVRRRPLWLGRIASSIMLIGLAVLAVCAGVALGVYGGVLAYFTVCEVFGLCRQYQGIEHTR